MKSSGQSISVMLQELDRIAQTYSRTHTHAAYIFDIMRGYACQVLGFKTRALDHYELAWTQLEAARRKLSTYAARVQFAGARYTLFSPGVKAALELQDKAAAFAWIERAKSRTLLDMLTITQNYKIQVSPTFLERWMGEPLAYRDVKSLLA